MIGAQLLLHHITDIAMATTNSPATFVHSANGEEVPCPEYSMTRIVFTDRDGARFEVLAFREGV